MSEKQKGKQNMDNFILVKKDKKYESIKLMQTANDDRLSWKAKGIYSYLTSRTTDWAPELEFLPVELEELLDMSRDKQESVCAGLRELEKCGYLEKNEKHKKNNSKNP